ncbi:MAG TPA: hypothetical protein VFK52_02890 [Nocardioidaceae bacterium]|nr:hypothetical protein [Nocardioidaceae bacterium]
MRLRYLGPLAALSLVVTVAAPAWAAFTATFGSGQYELNGTGSTDSVAMQCLSNNVSPAPASPTTCAAIESIVVHPGEGIDNVDLSGVTAALFPNVESVNIYADTEAFPVSADVITGTALDDRIYSDFEDEVNGGPGNDRIEDGGTVHGGPGNDILWRSAGNGGNFGDEGDDRFVNALSQTGNHGGAGDDTLEADFHQAAAVLDFELTFTASELQLAVGGVPAGTYPVDGFEHLVITLPEKGTQTFNAAAFPGDLHLRGFGGTDVITGTKKSDVIHGGTGNDTIEARDGVFDVVDCGLGTDVAKVDGFDKVVGCESLTYAKPSTGAVKGPKNIVKGRSGKFTFTSNVPGSVFQCKIDKQAWKSCSSPHLVATGKLSLGLHTLRVRAGYPKGNWDATPSKKNFGVTQ